MKLGLPTIAYLVVGGLGLINFFMGFADIWDGALQGFDSYFSFGMVAPSIFLLGGLLALPVILPGDKKVGFAPTAFSVTGALHVMFFTFATEPDVGTGTILLMIFGILQALAGVGAYLLDAGIIKLPPPNPYGHQPPPPGGYGPPSGQFPQQPGPFGQPGPPPGQQTTFAPQQGQFGQPGQQPPPQAPGTPPGGYPQQG